MSSNVKELKRAGADVVVTFTNGGRYRYYGVPDEVYADYQKADSKGAFVSKNLRGRFRTQKLEGDDA